MGSKRSEKFGLNTVEKSWTEALRAGTGCQIATVSGALPNLGLTNGSGITGYLNLDDVLVTGYSYP